MWVSLCRSLISFDLSLTLFETYLNCHAWCLSIYLILFFYIRGMLRKYWWLFISMEITGDTVNTITPWGRANSLLQNTTIGYIFSPVMMLYDTVRYSIYSIIIWTVPKVIPSITYLENTSHRKNNNWLEQFFNYKTLFFPYSHHHWLHIFSKDDGVWYSIFIIIIWDVPKVMLFIYLYGNCNKYKKNNDTVV